MSLREEFSSKGVEGVPSDDIGWHFGTLVPNTKGNVACKLCEKVVKRGITRFKEHICHKTGILHHVLTLLRKYEFLSQLRGDDYDYEEFINEDAATRKATRESLQLQHEWHKRQEFRQRIGGWSNTYEEGRNSHSSVDEYYEEKIRTSTPSETKFSLRETIPELVRSKSSKQPKITSGFMNTLRRKMVQR
ncbi:hypothetical protein REPUB_Repub04eG0169500 [Reevesia pubescens]